MATYKNADPVIDDTIQFSSNIGALCCPVCEEDYTHPPAFFSAYINVNPATVQAQPIVDAPAPRHVFKFYIEPENMLTVPLGMVNIGNICGQPYAVPLNVPAKRSTAHRLIPFWASCPARYPKRNTYASARFV